MRDSFSTFFKCFSSTVMVSILMMSYGEKQIQFGFYFHMNERELSVKCTNHASMLLKIDFLCNLTKVTSLLFVWCQCLFVYLDFGINEEKNYANISSSSLRCVSDARKYQQSSCCSATTFLPSISRALNDRENIQSLSSIALMTLIIV